MLIDLYNGHQNQFSVCKSSHFVQMITWFSNVCIICAIIYGTIFQLLTYQIAPRLSDITHLIFSYCSYAFNIIFFWQRSSHLIIIFHVHCIYSKTLQMSRLGLACVVLYVRVLNEDDQIKSKTLVTMVLERCNLARPAAYRMMSTIVSIMWRYLWCKTNCLFKCHNLIVFSPFLLDGYMKTRKKLCDGQCFT